MGIFYFFFLSWKVLVTMKAIIFGCSCLLGIEQDTMKNGCCYLQSHLTILFALWVMCSEKRCQFSSVQFTSALSQVEFSGSQC